MCVSLTPFLSNVPSTPLREPLHFQTEEPLKSTPHYPHINGAIRTDYRGTYSPLHPYICRLLTPNVAMGSYNSRHLRILRGDSKSVSQRYNKQVSDNIRWIPWERKDRALYRADSRRRRILCTLHLTFSKKLCLFLPCAQNLNSKAYRLYLVWGRRWVVLIAPVLCILSFVGRSSFHGEL